MLFDIFQSHLAMMVFCCKYKHDVAKINHCALRYYFPYTYLNIRCI